MKKVLVVLLAGLLFMVFASHDSYADPFGPPCTMMMGFHEEGMPMIPPMNRHGMAGMEGMPKHPLWLHLMDLGLDMQQREAIRQIKSRETKEMIRNRADEQIAGMELEELLDKDTVDMKAVEVKLRHIETAKTAMHLAFIRAIEDAKSKLTAEQRIKFNKMIGAGPVTGPPPPMTEGMIHGSMRIPPPPCGEKDGMHEEKEQMPVNQND